MFFTFLKSSAHHRQKNRQPAIKITEKQNTRKYNAHALFSFLGGTKIDLELYNISAAHDWKEAAKKYYKICNTAVNKLPMGQQLTNDI